MYRATATALALVSFLPRIGVAYQPIDLCCPPPCCCEAPPIECYDPCEPSKPAPAPSHKAATGLRRAQPSRGRGLAPKSTAPPAATAPSELPAPPPAPAPAPNADAISPQPLNTPDIEATVAAPPAASPAPTATPQATSPVETAPRYAAPPASEPATVAPTRYDDVFSDTPATTEPPAAEPETTEPETPATETQPAEESAPAEPAATAPAADLFSAPAEEETPPPSEETTPAPADEPASSSPEGEDLFGPSSSHDVLTQPGGWASNASRPWNDADGQLLLTGRITEVTAKSVVLMREDGQSQAVSFAHLGYEDLSFLRRQIDARQVQLANQAGPDEMLAEQSR
jgi:hypothetical protein